jgi:hypothetical protein
MPTLFLQYGFNLPRSFPPKVTIEDGTKTDVLLVIPYTRMWAHTAIFPRKTAIVNTFSLDNKPFDINWLDPEEGFPVLAGARQYKKNFGFQRENRDVEMVEIPRCLYLRLENHLPIRTSASRSNICNQLG